MPDLPPPVAAIDTNVIIEFFTIADIERDGAVWWKLEERRSKACGSLWLAMALDFANARTLSLRHEVERMSREVMPPHMDAAAWTAIATRLTSGSICARWNADWLDCDATVTGTRADRMLVCLAKLYGVVVVSRDAGLRRTAAKAGVTARLPAEHAAALGVTKAQAMQAFWQRFPHAFLHYCVDWFTQYGPFTTAAKRERLVDLRESHTLVRDMYRWIWAAEAE